MRQVLVERANHRAEREEGLLLLRVWRDPQLAAEAAAVAFEQTIRELAPLVASIEHVVLDLRDAPRVVGPRTQASLGTLLAQFARLRRRIALISSDDALQQLQLRRLIAESAPQCAVLAMDEATASAFLGRDVHARQ